MIGFLVRLLGRGSRPSDDAPNGETAATEEAIHGAREVRTQMKLRAEQMSREAERSVGEQQRLRQMVAGIERRIGRDSFPVTGERR